MSPFPSPTTSPDLAKAGARLLHARPRLELAPLLVPPGPAYLFALLLPELAVPLEQKAKAHKVRSHRLQRLVCRHRDYRLQPTGCSRQVVLPLTMVLPP